jgi:hypothetical protein
VVGQEPGRSGLGEEERSVVSCVATRQFNFDSFVESHQHAFTESPQHDRIGSGGDFDESLVLAWTKGAAAPRHGSYLGQSFWADIIDPNPYALATDGFWRRYRKCSVRQTSTPFAVYGYPGVPFVGTYISRFHSNYTKWEGVLDQADEVESITWDGGTLVDTPFHWTAYGSGSIEIVTLVSKTINSISVDDHTATVTSTWVYARVSDPTQIFTTVVEESWTDGETISECRDRAWALYQEGDDLADCGGVVGGAKNFYRNDDEVMRSDDLSSYGAYAVIAQPDALATGWTIAPAGLNWDYDLIVFQGRAYYINAQYWYLRKRSWVWNEPTSLVSLTRNLLVQQTPRYLPSTPYYLEPEGNTESGMEPFLGKVGDVPAEAAAISSDSTPIDSDSRPIDQ